MASWFRSCLLALSSAVLLSLSFPNFNQPWCAWVALVPWLLLLRGAAAGPAAWSAFGWSYLVGVIFFLGSIWWLIHVTLVGWLILCAYLALFFGLFGWFVSRLITGYRSLIAQAFLIPSAWVALEFLRSHLFSGFGWNLLGYSQTPALTLIQIADVTGVWGVSWLTVAINLALASWLDDSRRRQAGTAMLAVVGLLLAVGMYGRSRLAQPASEPPIRVAVVQGNIPQERKWDEEFQQAILAQYERLTQEAARQQPNLIIWPETSVPGYLGMDPELTGRVRQLAETVQTPVLVGAPMVTWLDGVAALTNSAVLLGADGAILGRYDKLHLVPFGEFIPLEQVFPWLRRILPPIGDFVPGRHPIIFELRSSHFELPPFSVLVCFEDIFPELAREFVRRGARLLVTITNDAWFGKTAAAYQHAQASTFRAVELRVPMVRSANTGWSGCIDPQGRWQASVRDAADEELFVEGVASCDVTPSATESVYRRWGDWFAWLCLGVFLIWLVAQLPLRQRVKSR